MLKTPKYAVTLFALAVVFLLAAPAVSLAENGEEKPKETTKFVDHGEGKQAGPTKMGDKSTPKRAETHGHGNVTTHNPNVGHLKGPEMRESGKGRLEGGEKKGDKSTPKRAPTQDSKPR